MLSAVVIAALAGGAAAVGGETGARPRQMCFAVAGPRAGPRAGGPQLARRAAAALHARMPLQKGSNVALVTPMDSQEHVDYGKLKDLLAFHEEAGTQGVVILGTTGEASVLAEYEKVKVMETTAAAIGGRIPIIVGTGTIDTQKTISSTKQAADHGADASLVVTPYYVKPPPKGQLRHFSAVANAVDLPMLLCVCCARFSPCTL